MKRIRTALATAGVLALGAAVAAARSHESHSGPPSWEGFADEHDSDRDGVVTTEELAATSDRVNRFDTDGDGRITESEFDGALSARVFAHLARWADEDEDGALTAAEWTAFLAARDADRDGTFERHRRRGPEGEVERHNPLDTDGDGTVEASETQALFARFDADGDGRVAGEEMPEAPMRRSHFGHGPRGGHFHGALLERFDEDGDGSVTRDEWEAVAKNRRDGERRHGDVFERIDANGDGVLSREEIDDFHPRGPHGRR